MSEAPSPRRAVALRYDFGEGAPRVIAKGEGHIAETIIKTAQEHDIAVEENPVLVEALAKIELESEIPLPLYKAVAEVIGFVLQTGKLKAFASEACPRT